MGDRRFEQSGLAILGVLLILLLLAGIGVVVAVLVERNTEQRAAYSKSVVGFYAAEAGLNVAAARVRNTLLGFDVPTDCSPRTIAVGNRSVTYTLAGCGQTPQTITVPAGEPFEGLNAIRYQYDVASVATNPAGFEEAVLQMRFQSRLIPMFQLVAFYKEDLELTVGPPMVLNGRMHTNKDMYLNTGSCDPGAQVLGQVTVVGELYRGRKDTLSFSNSGNVWIANPDLSLRILGRTGPGDTSCSSITTRLVPEAEAALWSGRVRTDLRNISMPGQNDLICAPWSCPAGSQPGSYWTNADLRLVLNATRTEKLDPDDPGAAGPALYALEVYNADGTVNSTLTARFRRFVRDTPGAITYSDVPISPECLPDNSCEGGYQDTPDYALQFPVSGTNGCTSSRAPRNVITTANYCNDFRYGGFYNWRERKPILMFNIDWMKFEEWNQGAGAQRLFDPSDGTGGGLVIYASVRGANSLGVNNYGVRLYNAQRLRHGAPDRGTTFATDQAVYVMGNFNCRAPNVISDTQPAGCGVNGKKPAAVVADTLNVLSCYWIDESLDGACRSSMNNGVNEGGPPYRPRDEKSTSARPGSMPQGRQTFINAAFLAGNDNTTCPGNPGGRDCQYHFYSGGLENYPRFHEDWSERFWYRGSFVAVDTPKHTCFTYNAGLTATDDPLFPCRAYSLNSNWLQGYWYMQAEYGYSPPPRRWFYDVDFNDAANLPPLAPRFVTVRLEFFTEQFR